MHMDDYIKQLDTILSSTGEKLLVGAGTISHDEAIEKAKYELVKQKNLKEYNGTILFVSHDRYFANKIAEREIRIWEAEDVEKKTYKKLMTRRQENATFIVQIKKCQII